VIFRNQVYFLRYRYLYANHTHSISYEYAYQPRSIYAHTQPETRKLQQVCCRLDAIIKPISGCVHIACSGLIISSLLQVVNRLAASCDTQSFKKASSSFVNFTWNWKEIV
jgi:hypothetical protein